MIQAILDWFRSEAGLFTLFSALKILGVFSVLMFIVAYAVWVERRTAAFIQDRLGPNREIVISAWFWGELRFTDTQTGRHATLFARSESEFFAGPAMYVPSYWNWYGLPSP